MNKLSTVLSFPILVALIACGGGENPVETVQSYREVADQVRKSVEEAGGRAATEPVNFRVLRDLLPNSVAGLPRADVSGETSGAMGFKISQAEARYQEEGGSSQVEAQLIDGGGIAFWTVGMAAWMTAEIDRENQNGYERTGEIDGYKSYEKYDREQARAELAVVIEDRFLITLKGNEVSMEELKRALSEVALAELKSLAVAE